MLIERPELTEQAVKRRHRPAGGGRSAAPAASAGPSRRTRPGARSRRSRRLGRHVLLLSATPLEDDAHGFFRLLQMLRPQDFPEDMSIEARLAQGTPLPACTSATRRADIGGLPPRVGIPIEHPATAKAHSRSASPSKLRCEARRPPTRSPSARRSIACGVRSHPAPRSAAVLGPDESELRAQALAMDAVDPRIEWLVSQAPRWRDAKEKTLVFVAHRETLEMLREKLSQRAQLATGMFHEALTPARRDTEVARFREADGPSLLVSTECGGEGRNFEFCRRLDPVRSAVEAVGRRAAHRPSRSHRPQDPGGGGLLSAGRGHRPRRRAAVRSARTVPRAARRASSRSSRRSKARSKRSHSIRPRRCPTTASTRWSATRRPRARAFAKRHISNCIAIRIGRRWRPASSRACPRSWTRSTRKW